MYRQIYHSKAPIKVFRAYRKYHITMNPRHVYLIKYVQYSLVPFIPILACPREKFTNLQRSSSVVEPRSVYIPVAVNRVKSILRKCLRVFRALLRILAWGIVWSPIATLGMYLGLLSKCGLAPDRMIDFWWNIVLWAIEKSGPASIKFSQWASTRPDLFPVAVCNRLGKLHASTTPHSWAETEKTLYVALGSDWPKNLRFNDKQPIGSGCVAQVYRGEFKINGKILPVAVKVLHPSIKDQIHMDIDILRFFSRIVEFLIPNTEWLSIRESVEEFSKLMDKQLDMKLEADSLRKLSRNFCNDSRIHFPVPIQNDDHELVLIESLFEGQAMSEYMLRDVRTLTPVERLERKNLGIIGLKAFLKMIFLDNFVHGDLHPGNILIYRDTSKEHSLAGLVFLDAGIVTELSKSDRRNFIDLFHAIAIGDGKRAGMLLLEKARANKCRNADEFIKAVDELVTGTLKEGINLRQIQVGQLIRRVLSLCATYKVKLESNFVSIVIAIGVLEGVGRALNPDIDILQTALPIILKAKIKGNI